MKWLAAILFVVCRMGHAEPVALIYDIASNHVLHQQGQDQVRPIASITKLMTAMVVLDSAQPMSALLQLDSKYASALPVKLYSRLELIHAILVHSDNAAAETLAANHPGGRFQFMSDMNKKSRQLGLNYTSFLDPSGLSVFNVSTMQDLAVMTAVASGYELIRSASVLSAVQIQKIGFGNTSGSLFHVDKNIVLTKTGFTNHAGYCVAMVINRRGKDIAVIVLGSKTKQQRISSVQHLLKSI